MKQYDRMRSYDVVVLLKIISSPEGWLNKDLSTSLKISLTEINRSINRSVIAGLLDATKKKVRRQALLEFLQYGLPYVFPITKGPITKGIPTAYSAPLMIDKLMVTKMIVWEHPRGEAEGESIVPLYVNAVEAAIADQELYDILALIDVLRLGKVREREIAVKLLKQLFDKNHSSPKN
jgi:hypothetical protein